MQPVSDPALLAQLNAPDPVNPLGAPVTDPALLKQLDGEINWSDVPGQAARNFLPSLGNTLLDIAQPIIHPIDTASNLKNLAVGVLQKTGVVSGEDSIKYADAFGQYFKERYGGEEGFKRTLAKDPAGVIADVSALLTGGETALARAPGLVGRAASAAGTVGRAVDPLNVITKPAAMAIRAADVPFGVATGAGPAAIQAARQAGRDGGAASEAFTSQMRQTAPIDEIVADARAAANQMRSDAQSQYVADMAATNRNPTQLSFSDIDAALNRVNSIVTYQGRPRRALVGIRDELTNLVNEWKGRDPALFHTPAGFDELKKVIYEDVLGNIPFEQRAQRRIAGDVYDAVKGTIVKQDPRYARTMEHYENASNQLREIERTLTGRPGAPVDSALRKLTSIMRNNVNANFGRRVQLAQALQAAGPAPQLTNKVAGASLNSLTPRGLATIGPQFGILGALTGALPLSALSSLAASSPRIVGEAQHALGRARRYTDRFGRPTLETLRQLGRTRNAQPEIQ